MAIRFNTNICSGGGKKDVTFSGSTNTRGIDGGYYWTTLSNVWKYAYGSPVNNGNITIGLSQDGSNWTSAYLSSNPIDISQYKYIRFNCGLQSPVDWSITLR